MMKARKKQYGPKAGGTYVERARQKWGPKIPDWIVALAQCADAHSSLGAAGKKSGLPAATVSAILGKTYPGKLERHEATVRGTLMSETVQCPVLGTIKRNDCVTNQQRKEFSAANPQRAQLMRACKTCPNALKEKTDVE